MKSDFVSAAQEYEICVRLAEQHCFGEARLAESFEGLATARWRADTSFDPEPLFNRAGRIRDDLLAEKEATPGEDQLEIANCLDRCAFHRRLQKNPSQALAFYQRALDIRKNCLGELHFDVANTLGIMAAVYFWEDSNQDSAVELWKKAVEILKAIYQLAVESADANADHVARSLKGYLENLALHAFDKGDYSVADNYYRCIEEVVAKSSGVNSRHVQVCNPSIYAKVRLRRETENK